MLDEPELGWKTLPQSVKGHLLFDLVDSKASGDPTGPGPVNANIYSADAVVSESGTESSASSESTGLDDADSPADDEEDFESNVLSAEFEPTASFDKHDILVRANQDQLGSLEETFVLWKHHVELLTTAADQSPGSQKMEERRRERGDKKLIWECYVGHQLLQHLPVRVETYSKQNGWDFSKPQIRGAFLARRSFLHPDEIMMSPRYTPSSSLDDLRSFQDKQQLMFCRKVYDRQLADVAECHLEHPVGACSWKQPELRNMDGFRVRCAQCRLGAEHRGLPHSTVSHIQTTKQLLARVIGFECRCLSHGEPDRNGSHSYPWLMAAQLAAGIAADSPEEFEKYLLELQPYVRTCLSLLPSKTFSIDVETCYPVDTVPNSTIDEYKQGMKELATKFDAQTVRTVAKLHDQFGHPSAKTLAHELHMRKCPKPWVACAKIYTCEWCATQRKPGLVRVAAIPRAQFFNHVVDTDIYVVKWQGKKRRIQAIMDDFTRF